MHVKKYLSIFLIGLAFAIAGCSSGSSSGGLDRDPIEDIDGDGIADIVDPDMDGDGIPNAEDPDDDNDGVEDSIDPSPPPGPSSKTCVAATILPPNDEISPGDNGELSWELLPQGCVLPATRANAGAGVTVRAAPQRTGTATSATANAGNCVAQGRNGKVQCFTEIKVPEGCGQFAVVYDISEVGVVLGDTNLSKGAYRQTVWHTGKSCVGEGLPNPCTQAINLKINEKKLTGDSTKITWDFAPSGCQLNTEQEESVAVVTATNQYAKPETKTSNQKWLLKDKNSWIIVPNDCQWYENNPEGIKKISYDFSGIGYQLGDIAGVNAGNYALDVTHKHGPNGKGCGTGEPEPEPEPEEIYKIGNGTIKTGHKCVSEGGGVKCAGEVGLCTGGYTAYVVSTENVGKSIQDLTKPSWSGDGLGENFMNLYVTKIGSCTTKRIDIYSYTDWATIQKEYGSCKVRQNADVSSGACNFEIGVTQVLKVKGAEPLFTGFSSTTYSLSSDETASDTDNDGIPNDSDSDVDGDGTPNTSDNDIDGDGIWNKDDPDIDGDGKTNGIDPDADGDGTPDAEDDTPGGPQ